MEEGRSVSIDDFSQFPPLQSTPVDVPKPPAAGVASDPMPHKIKIKKKKLAVVGCPECHKKVTKNNLSRHIKRFHKSDEEKQPVNKRSDDADAVPEMKRKDDIFDFLSDDEREAAVTPSLPSLRRNLKRNVSNRYPSLDDDSVIESDGLEKKKQRENNGVGMMTSTQMNFNDQLNLHPEEDDRMENNG